MRYKAVEEAEHGCCYGASVVDTTKPYHDRFEPICECGTIEEAQMIADALNKSLTN